MRYVLYGLDDYILKKPYENEYCKIYDINFTKLSKQELLFLIENIKARGEV